MKKIILGVILVLIMTTSAQAYWKVQASSSEAWGIGESNIKQQAIDIAMYECRMKTSTWNICYIDYIIWIK